MAEFAVVIPSRFASVRLPGKPLLDIGGKPMIRHVVERANESGAGEVIVATDDERIAEAVEGFGGTVCMTSSEHQSGTDRIAEVADVMDWPDSQVVVNLQGDEPAMPPQLLAECAALLDDERNDLATLASAFSSLADFENRNVVKVVRDNQGRALYFSRAPIPFPQGCDRQTAMQAALQHHGIYAYRCGVLRRFVAAEPAPLEQAERLEQLRALALGMRIAVGVPSVRPGACVDTAEDLLRVAAELGPVNRP